MFGKFERGIELFGNKGVEVKEQIFESEDIIKEYEMDVTVKKNISDFIQSECWNNMQQDKLIDILVTNKTKLISILQGE